MKSVVKSYPLAFILATGVRQTWRGVRFHLESSKLARARPAQIAAYFDSNPVRKLHIGAGPNHLPGWLNADLRPRKDIDVFLDAREPLPFGDGTLDYIYSEHFLLAIGYMDATALYKECIRVLRPGGRIRLAEPNLWKFAALCGEGASAKNEDYIRWYIDSYIHEGFGADAYLGGLVVNNMFKEAAFLYDPETLGQVLKKAGFVGIAERQIGSSTDPNLAGLESHGRVLASELANVFETFVIEAYKPQIHEAPR